jgi:hypothetical protein
VLLLSHTDTAQFLLLNLVSIEGSSQKLLLLFLPRLGSELEKVACKVNFVAPHPSTHMNPLNGGNVSGVLLDKLQPFSENGHGKLRNSDGQRWQDLGFLGE